MATTITPLPDEVARQIRSSIAITNLTQAVIGLLQNAIDAGAKNIKVSIDFRRGDCAVEDDGAGIPQAEFRKRGGLGRAHWTSKYKTPSTMYGRCGVFLASLTALALVTITSRQQGNRSLNEIVFHRGSVLARSVPAPSSHDLATGEQGTRVTLRNLFGGLPVRVKHRATIDDRAELEEWDAMKRSVVGLLVAWGVPVNVIISDGDGSRRVNIRHGLLSSCLDSRNDPSSNLLDSSLVLRVLTQAGHIESDSSSSWVPLSGQISSLSVKGLMSLDPAPNKHCQFISLGIHPISNATGHSEMYEAINRLVSDSDFGRSENDLIFDDDDIERRRKDGRYKQSGLTLKQIKAGKRGIDRWPMFYLRVINKCSTKEQNGLNSDIEEPQTNLQDILDIIRVMVTRWLAEHHFTAHRRKIRVGVKAELPSSTKVLRDRSPAIRMNPVAKERIPNAKSPQHHAFSTWSRIKSSNPSFLNEIWSKPTSSLSSVAFTPSPSWILDEFVVPTECSILSIDDDIAPTDHAGNTDKDRRPCVSVDHRTLNGQSEEGVGVSSITTWTDRRTRCSYNINTRTGMVQVPRLSNSSERAVSSRIQKTLSQPMAGLTSPQDLAIDDSVKLPESQWVKLAKTWKNPVFPQSEKRIPLMPSFSHQSNDLSASKCCREAGQPFPHKSHATDGSSANFNKLCSANLREAQVVAQVDRKFILVKMPMQSLNNDANVLPRDSLKHILALIDQHAADERCQIERLLSDLCQPPNQAELSITTNLGIQSSIKTLALATPLQFQIPVREYDLLRQNAKYFAKWGIMYDLELLQNDLPGKHDYGSKVIIKALPHGIAERCTREPKLLIDLLRAEIWDPGRSHTTARLSEAASNYVDASKNAHPWLRQFGDCPQNLVDILNSRSCRSAIMFNDTLSLEQCQNVVNALADCAFPFQCAHGRPSMAPLMQLNDLSFAQESVMGNTGQSSYVAEFRRWRGSTVRATDEIVNV